ncbi:MAG TPA: hypothetical protein VFV87_09200 [Pirellulaceae bacterium]|nr:hypothetical protein [Pirellulaceae bacterium]
MLRGLLAAALLAAAVNVFFGAVIFCIGLGQLLTGLASLVATAYILALGLVLVMCIWALAYRISPGPTKYLTVCGVLGGFLLACLPLWLIHAREEARRNNTRNNLRQLGMDGQLVRDSRRDVEPSNVNRPSLPWAELLSTENPWTEVTSTESPWMGLISPASSWNQEQWNQEQWGSTYDLPSSQSSMVRGQSSFNNLDSERSANSLPPVWQRGQ